MATSAEIGRQPSNAFEILGLGIGATSREIRRRVEERRIQLDLDGADPAAISQLRAAAAALQDPAQRLGEELYWIHCSPDPLPPDLDLADPGTLAAAVDALTPLAVNGSDAALHDLAILEYAAAAAAGAAAITRWGAAIERWRTVWASEAFWLRMQLRAEALDDPRVTGATVDRLRAELPGRILSQSAEAAAQLLAAGHDREAAEHLQLILGSGFPVPAVDKARASATEGVRARLRAASTQLRQAVEGVRQWESPDKRAALLREAWASAKREVFPLVEQLHRVDPSQSEVEVSADEASGLFRTIAVQLYNETDDPQAALEPQLAAQQIAGSETARHRATENLNTLHFRLAFKRAVELAVAKNWSSAVSAFEAAAAQARSAEEKESVHQWQQQIISAMAAQGRDRRRTRNAWIAIAAVGALIVGTVALRAAAEPTSVRPPAASSSGGSGQSPSGPSARATAPISRPGGPPSSGLSTRRTAPVSPPGANASRQELDRLHQEIELERPSIEREQDSLRSRSIQIEQMESRLQSLQNQYRFTGAPPNVVAEYERLRREYNGELDQYNLDLERGKRRLSEFNHKVAEYNALLARLRGSR